MSTAHAAEIHFDGRLEATKKRLQKLKTAGLISERPRRVSEPAICYISRRGLLLLEERGVLAEYPAFDLPALVRRVYVSDLTVRHELAVMDIKAAFFRAARTRPEIEVVRCCTWPRLLEFDATPPASSPTMVRPDGFTVIRERQSNGTVAEHSLFLEADMSSESLDTLVHRARCYFHHYQTGEFAVRNGINRYDFKKCPFRVLFVVRTRQRQANLISKLSQGIPPIRTFAPVVTFDEVAIDPFRSIVSSTRVNTGIAEREGTASTTERTK